MDLSWIWLDQYFDLDAMFKDNAMVRRLGGRNWQRLHRLVYFIGVGGVVHFLWLVKSDITQPLIYGVILAGLLGFRLWDRRRQQTAAAPAMR